MSVKRSSEVVSSPAASQTDTLSPDAVPFTPKGFAQLGISLPPSHASLHRWRLKGLRGIKIQTFLRGGRRFVTPDAVAAFFAAVTAAADGTPIPTRTPAARQRAIEAAERELDKANI